ncbi:DUF6382 domain-containing protein [Paenibacillus cremeus]|uniref:DUF6382 domain-containing protein n=1 Tax=Paenibacillus cremeus TaxID=2163881 RepID=UPI001C95497A
MDIQIYYNVKSKISLSQAVNRQKMSKDQFINLILGCVHAFKEVDEYQLVNKGVLLDIDLIFVKPGSFEPSFIYLPIYAHDEGITKLKEFIT